jgi:hypothetical protein
MGNEVLVRVIELFYENWFKDYVVGFSKQDLIRETGYELNQINQAVEFLENKGLIYNNNPRRYVITTYGIEKREAMFPPATLVVKQQERRRILETLSELYQKDVYGRIDNDTLAAQVQITDHQYLLGTVVYLEESDLVYLDMYQRLFFIRLTAKGFESLRDHIPDNSITMAIAYRTLFNLENYMRRFIEAKLKSLYGSGWWDRGITLSIRKDVNIKRKKEIDAGWKVCETTTNTEYLDFTDLERVIRKNWEECFESYFHDQEKVKSRLTMLENIRNSIAQNRTLTLDSMNRLQQNYDDLIKLMNIHQTS